MFLSRNRGLQLQLFPNQFRNGTLINLLELTISFVGYGLGGYYHETPDVWFTQRLFYCAKQFNFDILHINSQWNFYDAKFVKIYDMFPIDVLPNLRYIMGKNLKESVMETLNERETFTEFHKEHTAYLSKTIHCKIYVIIADNIHFEFVNCLVELNNLKQYLIELLQNKINIYVSRMIVDYMLSNNPIEKY